MNELDNLQILDDKTRYFLSLDGFIAYYYSISDEFVSNREVYEYLETIHERITGNRKYSDYNTFKQILSRHNKKYRMPRDN